FTIPGGSFLGPPIARRAQAYGEWPLHCHVHGHMMSMMASLLIVEEGMLATPLPIGAVHMMPAHAMDGHDTAAAPHDHRAAAEAQGLFPHQTARRPDAEDDSRVVAQRDPTHGLM